MRCLSCHRLSFQTFCVECRDRLLRPSIRKRRLDGFDVYSFFTYDEIEDFLLTKHTPQGYRVYRALGEQLFRPFIVEFMQKSAEGVYVLGIDEVVESGYSHVACLTHAMKYANVKILHAQLIAQNCVKYAGKTRTYREENPRHFLYRGLQDIEVILVDDVITTGSTLQEAQRCLSLLNVKVLFALTLADAS